MTTLVSNLSLLPGRIISAITAPSLAAFYSRDYVLAALKDYRKDVESDVRETAQLLEEDPDKAVQTQEIEVPLYTVLVDLCAKFNLTEDEMRDVMGINQWSAYNAWLDSTVRPALDEATLNESGGRADPPREQSYPF